MRDEYTFVRWNDETRRKYLLALKLYGFGKTEKELEPLTHSKGDELVIEPKKASYSSNETLMAGVDAIVENQRGTLKIVFLSNGMFCVCGKFISTNSMAYLNTDRSYDSKDSTVFDSLKEKMWVVLQESYWKKAHELVCLTDAVDKASAEKWVETYKRIASLRNKYENAIEVSSVPKVCSKGLVKQAELDAQEVEVKKGIAKYEALEALESTLRQTALDKMVLTRGPVKTALEFKGLDNRVYRLEFPMSTSVGKEMFAPFVYQHRYRLDNYSMQNYSQHSFFKQIFEILTQNFREQTIGFAMGGVKPVEVSFKAIKAGYVDSEASPIASYLGGKRVAYQSLYEALEGYFVQGLPLKTVRDSTDVKVTEAKEAMVLKKERDLMEEGIKGTLTDLEGDYPISIAFEKEGPKWYLTIGEHRLWLKGGQGMIGSLKTVLAGNALRYEARHSTEEFFNRLCKVLPEEQALEVVQTAKEMGKMIERLSGQKKEER